MKASSLTKSPFHFAQGVRIFSCFIWSRVLLSLRAFCTRTEVSFSILVKARTSSRFESAPWPGITFTSGGNCAVAFSIASIMPWTLPPAGHVNEGEAVAHEVVAHVDDIIFRKENDGVAVSVARWKMQGANVLTVQVHGDVVVKRDDRQGRLLRWFIFHLHGAAISGHAAGFQALAHIVLCDHRGTRVAEWRIPAGVVAVVVGVNDEAHRLVRNFPILQPGLGFFSHRS